MTATTTLVRLVAGCAVGLCGLSIGASDARACDCVSAPVPFAVKNSQLIVVGLVQSISFEAPGVRRVDLQVRDVFRRQTNEDVVSVYTAPYGVSCWGYDFKVGYTYVIFARAAKAGDQQDAWVRTAPATALLVALCSGTVDLESRLGTDTLTELKSTFRRRR
jgi:hypothetical protein